MAISAISEGKIKQAELVLMQFGKWHGRPAREITRKMHMPQSNCSSTGRAGWKMFESGGIFHSISLPIDLCLWIELNFTVAKTFWVVIINHADRLHKRIANRCANELTATLDKIPAERVRFRSAS